MRPGVEGATISTRLLQVLLVVRYTIDSWRESGLTPGGWTCCLGARHHAMIRAKAKLVIPQDED